MDRQLPRVHAVIPHHRGREMLGECLETLLASDGVDLEIVLVLNGCDEQLPEICETSPRVHPVATPSPIGFSDANNFGVLHAREQLGEADCYYFLNNDTRSRPDALRRMLDRLGEDPAAAVVGPCLRIQWAPDHLNSLGLNVTDDAWGWDEGIGVALDDYGELPGCREVLAVTGSALLVRAGPLQDVGGWTELYGYYFEDIDLCLKIRRRGLTVLNEPGAVVEHRVSATMTLESEEKLYLFWRNRLVLAMVHWPFGLLARLLRRAAVDEILAQPAETTALQRRALRGALRMLPAAMLARRRTGGGSTAWRRLLHPAGSVPVITLPDPDEAAQGRLRPLPASTWAVVRRLAEEREGRVLVLGCSPLPSEDARLNLAPGARTWQLARALAAVGNTVCAACSVIPGAALDERPDPPVEAREEGGVLVYRLGFERFRAGADLDALVDAYRPAVVVGATPTGSLQAVRVAGDETPVWVDLFGDPMAEAQAHGLVYPGDDGHLVASRDLMAELLARGDGFSAVSGRQRLAALGQLGLAGRLNAATAGTELVHVVPLAAPTADEAPSEAAAVDGIGEDDVVALWSGGFNTWCDVDTLVAGVDRAMAEVPALCLVVTGGGLRGHDERTCHRFEELVAASPFADRYRLLGALPERDAARVQRRADLGVVTERPLPERELGSSGRILEWVGRGVPVVCTGLSEPAAELAAAGGALLYPPGDAATLADVLVRAARDPELRARTATRAREWSRERWSWEETTRPLVEWVARAGRAPDRGRPNPIALDRLAAADARARAAEAEAERLRADFHAVRSELGRVHQSSMWTAWMLALAVKRVLTWPIRRLRER